MALGRGGDGCGLGLRLCEVVRAELLGAGRDVCPGRRERLARLGLRGLDQRVSALSRIGDRVARGLFGAQDLIQLVH